MLRFRNVSQLNILISSGCSCRNYLAIRLYATHKDPFHSAQIPPSSLGDSATSGLLSARLDRLGKRSSTDGDSVGPFQLGMIPPSNKTAKRWDELSRSGKVARTALRTTNFIVIILGAGFSGLLVYALASELFAKNSPTVLYNEVCERIKKSPAVASYLCPPFVFHTHPPLTHRPRHRARHVNSALTTDATGQEHLYLNFYIEGSDPLKKGLTTEKDTQTSIFEKLSWLSDLSLDKIIAYEEQVRDTMREKGKAAFSYLVGEPVHSSIPSTSSLVTPTENTSHSATPTPWSISWVFTRLTGRHRPVSTGSSTHYVEKKYWKSGEVHVDLVKVKESESDTSGKFVVRYIIISLPDSNNRNPVRLYVERMPDVLDNEGVIRWSS